MKAKKNLAQRMSALSLLSLIFFACHVGARAQSDGTVIPTVCLLPNSSRAGITTLLSDQAAASTSIILDTQGGTLPLNIRIVINQGSANEESFSLASPQGSDLAMYQLQHSKSLTFAHTAGEKVLWFTDATAVWGYKNTGSATVNIPTGLLFGNYFVPGRQVYSPQQPGTFLPGIHTSFSFDIPMRGESFGWFLGNEKAMATTSTPPCSTITYQGRLTDAGSAANGVYDLQFTAYDQMTGGAAQSESIVVEDVQVTNGIFTVRLKFNSSLYGNNAARYLEIGVRAGAATGAFTTLAPRQVLTDVPFAINAQTATNVFGGFVQLPLTTGAPPTSECTNSSQYGRQKVDSSNSKLYVCVAGGWKFTTLQ